MKGHGEGVPLCSDFVAIVASQQLPQDGVVGVQGSLHHLTVPAGPVSSKL